MEVAAWLCIGQLAGGVSCADTAACDVVCPIVREVFEVDEGE